MSSPIQAAPLGLRLVHAAMFLGLAALAIVASLPEWEQLQAQHSQSFTVGEVARRGVVIASVVAGVSALGLLVALVRRRSASSLFSILIGLSLAWCGLSQRDVADRPSSGWVNLELLQSTRGVQHRLGSQLQHDGEVAPTAEFVRALGETTGASSIAVHDSGGRRLGLTIVPVESRESPPAPVPGNVWLWRAPGNGAFALRPVGLTATGEALPLVDEAGAPLWLEATYQPKGPLLPARADP